ncbi:hypothetical protein LINPERPRIM_LOCUS35818 [Linum perenne]
MWEVIGTLQVSAKE